MVSKGTNGTILCYLGHALQTKILISRCVAICVSCPGRLVMVSYGNNGRRPVVHVCGLSSRHFSIADRE